MLKITGQTLQIEDVVAVADGMKVALDPSALPNIERSRAAVEQLVTEGTVAYGITTGFGRFKDKIIPPEQIKQLQLNLVRSHAAGMGTELDERTVRAMLVVRANTLALGYSGVRPLVIETLLDRLTHGIHPCIPCQGSLGASGDLAPLAHLTLALIGEGEVIMNGEALNMDRDWGDEDSGKLSPDTLNVVIEPTVLVLIFGQPDGGAIGVPSHRPCTS